MDIILHQTLEDRGNPDDIEQYGPFCCKKQHAWLGYGYYFWDTHIELGHWWGNMNYKRKGYVVCTAFGKLDDLCWDLYGNGKHRIEFKDICDELIEKGVTTIDKIKVATVIEFFKKKKTFSYKSIRALGINSVGNNEENRIFVFRLPFTDSGNFVYFDGFPPVQICLIEKKALSLRSYKIVYPKDYTDNYA